MIGEAIVIMPRNRTDEVPPSHPRRVSLLLRNLIVQGLRDGITSEHGLIAHGRGEALDYLLGEATHDFAKQSILAAAAALITAQHPVISVNGNTAALVPNELVQLANTVGAMLEVNIFHYCDSRVRAIARHLEKHGAETVLIPDGATSIHGLRGGRRFVNSKGIAKADWVFVPLEDGDRCAALQSAGKRVATIDLNPLSRTARDAKISIVDNVARALPILNRGVEEMLKKDASEIAQMLSVYNNESNLQRAETLLRSGKF